MRVLIAGIGNVFLGDDGFGVALAGRLARRDLPAGVDVVDYGIRGMDLAYALLDGWDAVILLDATPRGEAPGTLYVIEPDVESIEAAAPEAHGMDPVRVLALARAIVLFASSASSTTLTRTRCITWTELADTSGSRATASRCRRSPPRRSRRRRS